MPVRLSSAVYPYLYLNSTLRIIQSAEQGEPAYEHKLHSILLEMLKPVPIPVLLQFWFTLLSLLFHLLPVARCHYPQMRSVLPTLRIFRLQQRGLKELWSHGCVGHWSADQAAWPRYDQSSQVDSPPFCTRRKNRCLSRKLLFRYDSIPLAYCFWATPGSGSLHRLPASVA